MKLKYIIIAAAFCLTSCNDSFLEKYPQNVNDATFWKSVGDLKTYANNFYSMLPSGLGSIDDGNSDNQVPNNISTFIWNQYVVPAEGGGWDKSSWNTIRELNYFMKRYELVQGETSEINKYVAEIRFFRAIAYAAKIDEFGDVPWLEEDLNISSSALYGPRTARNEVAKKVVEDLDFAINWLPEEPEKGRLHKDAARHYKARFCLHEGTYYKYHTQLGYSNDAITFLRSAANVAEELINSGKYEIYSTGNPDKDYYDLFIIEDKSNLKEVILRVEYNDPLRRHNISRILTEANTGFSKDFVDSYLCTDGKPIALSNLYEGDENMRKESANRDPRFKQNILTNDFPLLIADNGDTTYIESEADFISIYCYTGYKSIKYFIPTQRAFETNTNVHDGIAYRYAETLLIYAEAKAELGECSQDVLDKTINKLKERAGMPYLTTDVGFTDPDWPRWEYDVSPLLQEIRRERRIELAGEGFRWGDLKRWKAGVLLDNVKTYVGKKKDGVHYAIVYPNYTNENAIYEEGKSRKWNNKLYLYPLPTGELNRNPALLPQNTGWQ